MPRPYGVTYTARFYDRTGRQTYVLQLKNYTVLYRAVKHAKEALSRYKQAVTFQLVDEHGLLIYSGS